MFDDELNKVMRDRREKLANLVQSAVNPFPYRYEKTHSLEAARSLFDPSNPEAHLEVKVAGRIIAPLRLMGKAAFTHLQDESGRLQAYLRLDDLGEETFQWAKKLDVGDIVGISGYVFKTSHRRNHHPCARFNHTMQEFPTASGGEGEGRGDL